MDIARTSQP